MVLFLPLCFLANAKLPWLCLRLFASEGVRKGVVAGDDGGAMPANVLAIMMVQNPSWIR